MMRFADVVMARGALVAPLTGEGPQAKERRVRRRRRVYNNRAGPAAGGEGLGAHPTLCTLVMALFAISAATAALRERSVAENKGFRFPTSCRGGGLYPTATATASMIAAASRRSLP